MPLPDPDFAREWSDCIDRPMFSSTLVEKCDEAIAACVHVSAIVTCRRVRDLHPEEGDILAMAVDTFRRNREIVANAAGQTETAHFALALDYLDRAWGQVVDEYDSVKANRAIEDPLCMTPHLAIAGVESEQVQELAAIRLVILQAECSSAIAV